MAPALAAVGTYALLFAWNDYFYQYMLLQVGKAYDRRHGAGAVLR